jgi:nitrate/nitrite transporter NarK
LPPLLLIGVWAWYGRNSPAEHASVSGEELGELDAASNEPADASISLARAGRILTHRAVLLLTLSYISMNYVFYLLANWCFLYLIQERHFTSLEGGMLASLPPLAAAVGAGTGGAVTDRLCRRFGLNWGYRLLPLIALPLAGVLLIAAVASVNAYGAVVALTLAFGVIELTEGSYWAATMRIAKADTMAATGVLNTGGNLGGIIGIPIVAYLSGHHAWTATFVLGLAMALLAAIAWFGVDATRPMTPDASASASAMPASTAP